MSNYVLGVVLEARDRMTATVQRGLTGLRNLRTGCSSASTGLSGVQASAERVGRSTEQLGRSASNASRGISSLTGGLGGMLGGLVGVGAAVSGINMFKQFDDTMLAVKAKTKATGEEFTSLREKAKELGASTRFSASEAAKGMDYLAMAGYKTNEIIDAMPGLLNLAAASGEGLASVSDIVSDVMTAFGWAAKDTEKFADIMAYAASNSNTSVGMMGESFKYVASVASSAGVSAQETATALALMANAGVKGSMGGTALRSSLIRLIKPPKEAADAMEFLGVQAVDNTGNFVGLRSIVAQMTEKTQGMTKAQKASAAAAIFGTEAVSGMMGMINQGPEAFDKFLAGVENSKGASSDMAAVMNSGIGGAIDNMTSALENVVICAGDKFAPTIAQAAIHVADFAMEISKVDFNAVAAGVIGLATAFGIFKAVGIASAIMGAVSAAGGIGAAITVALGPVGIAAIAIGALVAAGIYLYNNWDTVKAKAIEIWGQVTSFVSDKIQYIAQTFQSISNAGVDLCGSWSAIKERSTTIWQGVGDTIDGSIIYCVGLYEGFINSCLTTWESIKTGVNNGVSAVGTIIKKGVSAYVNFWLELPNNIAYAIGLAIGFISTLPKRSMIFLQKTGTAVQKWGTELTTGVGIWLLALPNKAKEAGTHFITTVSNFFANVYSSASIWVMKTVTSTGMWLMELPDKMIVAGVSFLETAVGCVTSVYSVVTSWVSNTVNETGAFLMCLPEKSKVAGTALITSASEWARGLYTSIKEWVVKIPSLVSDAIYDAKNSVSNWWGGMGANFSAGVSAGVSIPQNATGTNFFSGGLTSINERGGEILDLPRGTRIYPAATTQKIIKQEVGSGAISGSKFIAQISGNYFTVREEADINKIAEALVQRLERASLNAVGG